MCWGWGLGYEDLTAWPPQLAPPQLWHLYGKLGQVGWYFLVGKLGVNEPPLCHFIYSVFCSYLRTLRMG